jgi:bile acid:Na+ symporter, BASS family
VIMEALLAWSLPAVLVVVMFGLGLSIEVSNLSRLWRERGLVAQVLLIQLLLLPLVSLGLVIQAHLHGMTAVGVMLIASAPGGPGANLFSRAFRGDVELSIALTAISTLTAALTVPMVMVLALNQFDTSDATSAGDVALTYAIVFVAMLLGALARRTRPAFAERSDLVVRAVAPVLLVALAILVLIAHGPVSLETAGKVVAAVVLLGISSFVVGFAVPRLGGIPETTSIAAGFVVGFSNATLAIYVAVVVLGSVQAAVPAAVYGLAMFGFAAAWGLVLTRVIEPRRRAANSEAPR